MIVIKIKNIFWSMLFVTVLIFSLFLFKFGNEVSPAFSTSIMNKTIVIDAGHGGIDSGATTKNSVEKELNLKIATKLQAFLEEGGAVVFLTRNEDKSLHKPKENRKTSLKKSDLLERKRIMDESKADIFVSIHMNKSDNPLHKGSQVFYSKHENSKNLAESIQFSLAENFKSGKNRQAKELTEGVFLLKNARIPAVIVECGFISSPEEEKKLNDEIYQRKIAWAINLGIMKYFLNIQK